RRAKLHSRRRQRRQDARERRVVGALAQRAADHEHIELPVSHDSPPSRRDAPLRYELITKERLRTRHERVLALRGMAIASMRERARSAFRRHPRDEARKRRQLLLDEAARGFVLELAGLFVEFRRAVADEDLRLVERKGVEKHLRLAQ